MASPSFTHIIPHLAPCGIPAIGIGTYKLYGENCVQSVCSGIQSGFRLIDTAAGYKNEELVGEGIQKSGVDRSKLFVVVKILLRAMKSKDEVKESILGSIRKLRINYADCVIMHWPGCHGLKPDDHEGNAAARRRCWEVMIEFQKKGLIRFIGVSNFLPRHFEDLEVASRTLSSGENESGGMLAKPVLNQIELHPLCLQEDVLSYCRAHDMVLQQYAPLGEHDERLLAHPKLLELQQTYFPKHTIYDILIMWGLAQGFCVLVKSSLKDHHRANFQAAVDYFASVRHQAKDNEEQSENESAEASVIQENKHLAFEIVPRLLSARQLEVIKNLRELMNVREDTHICWYSENIA